MSASRCKVSGGRGRRGSVLVLVSAGMVMLLGVAGLAIDLAGLYVARNEAQRSADAAALAGAHEFVTSGFTSGAVTEATVRTLATQKAIDSGSQNYVGTQAASILASDVTFDFSNPANPLISVLVQRTAARANAMPTFFVKIFGVQSADVGASATVEAFNPSGSTISVGTKCLKPWLMPNCDSGHLVTRPIFCTNRSESLHRSLGL